jgi:hypothetical protein
LRCATMWHILLTGLLTGLACFGGCQSCYFTLKLLTVTA